MMGNGTSNTFWHRYGVIPKVSVTNLLCCVEKYLERCSIEFQQLKGIIVV